MATDRPDQAALSTVQGGTSYAIHLTASNQLPPPESGTTLRDRASLENGDYVMTLFAATVGAGGAYALPADNLTKLVIILDGSIVLEQPGSPALALAVGHAAAGAGGGTFRVDVTGNALILLATLTLANPSS